MPPPTGPGLHLPPYPKAPLVLPAAASRPLVSSGGLRSHLTDSLSQPGLGGQVGFAVSQLGSPARSWAHGARTVTPASTLKLLTTTAAFATLGPSHRFVTSTVQGRSRGWVVLVGGGDPLLVTKTPTAKEAPRFYPQPASLQRLAEQTAARLAAEGVRRVHLGYDASLFSGPAVNPHRPTTYIPENVVSPITSLWVNEGRDQPRSAPRSADPTQAAADAFKAQLEKAGIAVVGRVGSQVAPTTAPKRLGAVESAPLDEIVQHILELSDNEGAEVLLRQVAVAAGLPGSSDAGVVAVRRALTRLGLDLHGAVFYDGSGLSRDDRVPVQLLLHTLETDASPAHPELRGVITGLPVAGFSGSLGYRFEKARSGLGYVRAKTGTLSEAGVHSLAGVATTRSGQALAFVAVADRVPVIDTLDARDDLDRIAADVSTCGC